MNFTFSIHKYQSFSAMYQKSNGHKLHPLPPAAACFCLISFFVPTRRIPDPQSLLKLLKVRIQLQLKCFHQNPSSRQKTATKDFDSSKAMSSWLPQKPGNQCFTSESL